MVTPPGGGATGVITFPSQMKKERTEAPNTGINLQGCFEKWGISPDTKLAKTCVEFEGLTAQQVKQILQRIPSTFKASLEVEYPEQRQEGDS